MVQLVHVQAWDENLESALRQAHHRHVDSAYLIFVCLAV